MPNLWDCDCTDYFLSCYDGRIEYAFEKRSEEERTAILLRYGTLSAWWTAVGREILAAEPDLQENDLFVGGPYR